MSKINFINFICRMLSVKELSTLQSEHMDLVIKHTKLKKKIKMYAKYSPIEHIFSLEDRPGLVYVWKLRAEIQDYVYTEHLNKSLREKVKELKAIHLFTNDLKKITKLEKDEVQILLEHHYSIDAQEGGRP